MLPHHLPPPSISESLSRLSSSTWRSVPRSCITRRWFAVGCIVLVTLIWIRGAFYDIALDPPELLSIHVPFTRPPPPPERPTSWKGRKHQVRQAFQHAWKGYKRTAFPGDELLSVSGGPVDKYNGWSVTLFDSLDTMWIMGLKDEFNEAVDNIKDRHFNVSSPDNHVPFFETTIRYLGGLLSAHALSGEPVLLKLAEELGQTLLPVFRDSPTGLPAFSVNVQTGKVRSDMGKDTIPFAEAASCQLEFKYLAKLTGKKEFYQRVQTAMDVFYRANATLFHDRWSINDGIPRGVAHFTAGATADSGYEYLLKQWLQSGDIKARDQYIKSARAIIENLLYVTPVRRLLYVGELTRGNFVHRLEHLSCYLGGVFALGVSTLTPDVLPPEEKELHAWAAKGLTYTCALVYADQLSGLGPDEITMPPRTGRKWIREIQKWKDGDRNGPAPGTGEPPAEMDPTKRDYWNTWANTHMLRPETVESLFYMWRTTGDIKWRERGYEIFHAIESQTRTKYGYSAAYGIDGSHVSYRNYMPSWFLAETLKYLYMLFDDDNLISLDKWVFNTEAHPLPIFEWTAEEKENFGITAL